MKLARQTKKLLMTLGSILISIPLLRTFQSLFRNNQFTLMILSTVIVIICCGPDSEDKSFNDSSYDSAKQSSTESSSPGQAGPCLSLSNCISPAQLSFSFAGVTALNDPACTYYKVDVFDAANHLQLFVFAKCGLNPQLMTFQASYDLKTFTTPEVLSTECDAVNGSIGGAFYAAGDGGFLVTELCQNITGYYTVYLSKLSDTGTKVKKIIIDDMRTIAADKLENVLYSMAWNGVTQQWGINGNRLFRRYDTNLNPIGGSDSPKCNSSETCTSHNNYAWFHHYIAVRNEEWILFNGYNYMNIYSKLGVRRCAEASGGIYVLGSRIFRENWYSSGSNLPNRILDFASCTYTESSDFKNPLETKEYSITKQPFQINAAYAAIPYFTPDQNGYSKVGQLNLSFLNNATIPEWVVRINVADNVSRNNSQNIFTIGSRKIYAAYIQNNTVVISSSDKEIP